MAEAAPRVLSRLEHERAGSGPTVVLLHGIGHRREAWEPVFGRLAENHDVIAVDLAGFGRSPAYPAGIDYDMHNACANLAANFAEWGIERPHVVGNSLGGSIALELAARDLVSSATALSPAGFFGRLDRVWVLTLLLVLWVSSHLPDSVLRAATRSPRGRNAIGMLLYARPERATAEAAYHDARALRDGPGFLPTLRSGLRYTYTAQPRVPVTIAWGTADRVLPYRQAGTALRRMPAARHLPLKGAGHVPMPDLPDSVVQVIEETVASALREAR